MIYAQVNIYVAYVMYMQVAEHKERTILKKQGKVKEFLFLFAANKISMVEISQLHYLPFVASSIVHYKKIACVEVRGPQRIVNTL